MIISLRHVGELSLLSLLFAWSAHAQTVNVPSGLPPTVNATYQEVGMGDWKPPTTALRQINGGGSVVSTTPASGSHTDALQALYSQSWGYAAAENANAVGVSADALAATCKVESQCRNITAYGANSSVVGAFQMKNATYTEEMAKALQSNPALAARIGNSDLSGQTDPAIQAVAAAQYLKDAAHKLQSSGISNPTALDTRAYYNFGGNNGAAVAQADSDMTMSDVMPDVSQDTLRKNGVSPGETVGQWRAAVAAQMGASANVPVLTS